MKSYNELITFPTFKERLLYLSCVKFIGEISFGHQRYLNQVFYRSSRWHRIRDVVITRDLGCDLAIPGYEILDRIIIHHINPLTVRDIEEITDFLIDPDFLITTSYKTHQVIHYGGGYETPVKRTPDDHILWR